VVVLARPVRQTAITVASAAADEDDVCCSCCRWRWV